MNTCFVAICQYSLHCFEFRSKNQFCVQQNCWEFAFYSNIIWAKLRFTSRCVHFNNAYRTWAKSLLSTLGNFRLWMLGTQQKWAAHRRFCLSLQTQCYGPCMASYPHKNSWLLLNNNQKTRTQNSLKLLQTNKQTKRLHAALTAAN